MKLRFCLRIGLLLLLTVSAVPAAILAFSPQKDPKITFILDAGHGGEDGGAVSPDGTKESEVNLAVTLRTDALLGLFGYSPRLTRSSERIEYPPEAKTTRERKRFDQQCRASLTNSTTGGVLVSIHQNKFSSEKPAGAQVFFGKADGSEAFAVCLQNHLNTLSIREHDPIAISEEIFLLREARCPSVLIECGFLSNPSELAMLRTEAYQTKLSICIAGACIGQSAELEHFYGKG